MLQHTHRHYQEAVKIFELFEELPFSNHNLFQCNERASGELLKQVLVKSITEEDVTEIHIAAQLEDMSTISMALVPVPGGYLPVVHGHESSRSDEQVLEFALNYLSEIRFEMEKRQRQHEAGGQGGGGKEGYFVEARQPSLKNELYIEAAVRDGIYSPGLASILRRMGFRVQGKGTKVID